MPTHFLVTLRAYPPGQQTTLSALCDLCAALAQDNSGPIAPTREGPTAQEGEEAPTATNRHATAPTVGWEQGKEFFHDLRKEHQE
jgi:hypothetical protein